MGKWTAGELRAVVAPTVEIEDLAQILGAVTIVVVRREDCICPDDDPCYMLRMNTDLGSRYDVIPILWRVITLLASGGMEHQ